jgi:predicted dehydrogenase
VANTPVRWGIVGAGGIAATFTEDLRLSSSGTVHAVGSRRQETADEFGEVHGVPRRYGSYADLVEDPEVDVVYVATLNAFHADVAVQALRAGKPVLVEKPFAADFAQATRIVDEARRANLFAMEAMWTRFLPHMVEVKRLIADGALGDVVTVLAEFGHWFPLEPGSRVFSPELGGGALIDVGVYVVSFSSMVLGAPTHIKSLVEPAFTGVDANTSMLLRHRGGAHSVLTCTSLAMGPEIASIIGTEGRIDIDPPFYAPTTFTFVPRAGELMRYDRPHEGRGLRHQADEVARCLASGLLESPVMPLDETLSIMATMGTVLGQTCEHG